MIVRRTLKTLGAAIPVALFLTAAGCGHSPTSPNVNVPFSQTDTTVGSGAAATAGHQVTVSYTGWLYDSTKSDHHGTQFDSSNGFAFTVGIGQVIAGWDQGIPGMKVGGTRILVIPPSMGYGSVANGPIPANSTLVFQVTLLTAS